MRILNPFHSQPDSSTNANVGSKIFPGDEFLIWSARGGHGATTIAGALGVFLDAGVRSEDPEALAWMWKGAGRRSSAMRPEVVDAGVLGDGARLTDLNIVVLRGPCSLGLLRLAPRSESIDYLILIQEPWRSIRRRDVEAALGMKVSAEVAHSPRVARLADAGLLSKRVAGLDEFAELQAWATAMRTDLRSDQESINAAGNAPMPPSA